MILSLRLHLVAVLVLLQLIAPLVHAHTNAQIASMGIHLPGLEKYGQSLPATSVIHDALPCKIVASCHDSEGIVVGIHTGLQRETLLPIQRVLKKITNDWPHEAVVYDWLKLCPAFHADFTVIAIDTTPRLVSQFANLAHSPRAPPSLYA